METLAEHNGLRLVIGDASHLAWAGERVGVSHYPPDAKTLVVEGPDGIRAVAIYNDFTDVDCEMHVVSNGAKNFATRGMIFGFFALPFLNCGLSRVTTTVAQRNVDVQKLALDLGFKFEGVKVNGYADDNMVIMGMTRDDCIWIKEH